MAGVEVVAFAKKVFGEERREEKAPKDERGVVVWLLGVGLFVERTVCHSVLFSVRGRIDEAVAGQSVTICFADEVDCSRGNVIAVADAPPEVSDQFEATIVWMDDDPLHVGRAYWLRIQSLNIHEWH
mgnify:CR=1 FL=1